MDNEAVETLLEQADRLYSDGRLKDALEVYREVLLQDAESAWAHNRIGAILAQKGDLDAAEASFNRALEIKPDLAQAHSNLGNILFSRGAYDAALQKYKDAVALNPDNAVFHQNLHAVYKKLGKLTEAVSELKQANRLTHKEARADSRADLETMKGRMKGRFGCLGTLMLSVVLLLALGLAITLL